MNKKNLANVWEEIDIELTSLIWNIVAGGRHDIESDAYAAPPEPALDELELDELELEELEFEAPVGGQP